MAQAASMTSVLAEIPYAASSDSHQHCLVCYGDLTSHGKTPCQHDDICGVCHLRLRFLHNDKKCPICKQENERLIVDSDRSKAFQDYPMWGDEIGGNFTNRDDVGIFFETSYYELEILPLFRYACQKCEYSTQQEPQTKHPPLRMLKDHLRTQHRLTLCALCVDNKRDFVAKLPRFTPAQLQKHLKQGDGPTSGFSGHPVCEFCAPKRFYDLAFLHQHLHKDHYKCHVCEKQGLDNQFFKNYQSLERHFDRQHFMCHDVQCLAARFVVFENELDLRAHELSVHGGTSTGSTKINLEFRTRRVGYDGSGLDNRQAPPSESDFNYGLDGQAFVPPALPNSRGDGSPNLQNSQGARLHPLHLQRTEELRAQAAVMREQQALQSQEESFPSLQSATAGASSTPLVSWSTASTLSTVYRPKKQAGQVTEEDFPTLGPSPLVKENAKKQAIKGNLAVTRRQFAAMSTSSASPASNSGWSNTAVRPTPIGSETQASSLPTTTNTTAATNPGMNLAASNFPALGPPSNQSANLASSNFPALGPPTNQRANLAASNFPALGPPTMDRPTNVATHNYVKKAPANQTGPTAPPIDSTADFPTIGAAYKVQGNGNSVRDKVLGSAAPTQQAMANVLQAPTTSFASAKASIEEMKASLGPNKFKQLKRITRDFAEGDLSPEGYVDQCAAMFSKGYADPDFWSFLPSLIDSCPNEEASEHAMIYMTSLRRQQFEEKKPATRGVGRAPVVGQSWGAGPAIVKGPPSSIMMAAPRVVMPAAAGPRTVHPPQLPHVTMMAGKKKQAWGGTGAATVVRVKAPPGSVAAAAAAQGPTMGSATKFMAKQAKQQTKANSGVGGPAKNKSKQKDELKSLAFGGK